MSSPDIYALALPKAKNLHFLKRYLNFIEQCKIANKINPPNYTENHHILPRAKDLFPEFADHKRKYEWNSVNLSFRQHLIAHIMLWKIFGGSQTMALTWLLSENTNIKFENFRKIPSSLKLRYLERVKMEWIISVSGKSNYYDIEGNAYLLDCDDPLIQEMNLVTTICYTDGVKNYKIPRNREPDPSWIKGMSIDPEVQAGIAEFNSRKFTGSQFWNDGVKNHLVFVGQEPNSDWVRGMLVDDAMIKRNRESIHKLIVGCTVYNDGIRSYKLKAGCEPESHWVKGYVPKPNRRIYNNGIDQRMFDNDPGGEWVLGVIKGNVGRPNRRMYNNGEIQKMFDNDPGGEWKLGKLDKSGMKAYNNGIESRLFKTDPGEGWVKGLVPRKKKG